jgi:hypothetical protein
MGTALFKYQRSLKTSHFEGSIAFGAAKAALERNVRTQRELPAFDFNFGGGKLVTGKGASTDVIEASARAYF